MEFTKVQKQISISDFRRNMATYFKRAAKKPVFLSGGHSGEPRVVLGMDLYNKFLEAYEDEQDARELAQLVCEDDRSRVSLGELKKKYGL